jgi:hypothetical protein
MSQRKIVPIVRPARKFQNHARFPPMIDEEQ